MRVKNVLAAASLVLALAMPVARAEVVDRVVAVVGDQLVLASDVQLESVIAGLDRSPSPFWDRDRRTPEERLVEAAVFRELAGDVSLYQPDQAELDARLNALRQHFPNESSFRDFLDFWGHDDASMARLLVRRMVVERYLARNLVFDSEKTEAWELACQALLEQVVPRYRIRRIEATPAP